MYKRGRLLCAVLVVFGLLALLGGCVGVRERFLGMTERTPGIDPDPGRSFEPRVGAVSSPLLACSLREVSPTEAGIDPEALWKDPQITALKERLERRGLKPIVGAIRLLASQSAKLGLLPFSTEAGIAFEERAGQRTATALVKQANGTLNIAPDGREELWTLLSSSDVESVVNTLKWDQTFATFEKSLAAQGWRLQPGQSLGVQTLDKGLLYLAVAKDLSSQVGIEYYRIQVSRSGSSYRMVAGTQRALCSQGDAQVLGMPAGAVMSVVGAYGESMKLQAMPTDLCLMGLDVLACWNMRSSLSIRNVDVQGDDIFMEFLFESALQQQLRIRYSFHKARKEAVVTLESPQGDRLQGDARILQLPDKRRCAAFLPPDFSDPQRLQEAYQCLTEAGLRVELRLQLNRETVTIPAELLSTGDYATIEQLVQAISNKLDFKLKEALEAFKTLTDNKEEVKKCLPGQQTQPTDSRMIALGSSLDCAGCILSAIGYVGSWLSLFLGPPGTVAGAVVWIITHEAAVAGSALGCGQCLKNKNQPPPPPPPPPGGGGCFIKGVRSVGLVPTPC
nr:hypothetical protein HGMM_OP1C020 [Candidatus Acetothermum autotrophicum]